MLQNFANRLAAEIKAAEAKHVLCLELNERWPATVEPVSLIFPDQTAEQTAAHIWPVAGEVECLADLTRLLNAFLPRQICITKELDMSLDLSKGPEVFPVWMTTRQITKDPINLQYEKFCARWYNANVQFCFKVQDLEMIPECFPERIRYHFGHVKYYATANHSQTAQFLGL